MGGGQSTSKAKMRPMSLKMTFDPTEVGVEEEQDTLSEYGTILLLIGSILSFFFSFVWVILYNTSTSTQRAGSSRWSLATFTLAAIGLAIGGGVVIATHDKSTGVFVNTTLVDVNVTGYPIVGATRFCDPLFIDNGYHNGYDEECVDNSCLSPSYAVDSLCKGCLCYGWDRVNYADFANQPYCLQSEDFKSMSCVTKSKGYKEKCTYDYECISGSCPSDFTQIFFSRGCNK